MFDFMQSGKAAIERNTKRTEGKLKSSICNSFNMIVWREDFIFYKYLVPLDLFIMGTPVYIMTSSFIGQIHPHWDLCDAK